MKKYLILRSLAGSDLGWFGEARRRGKARGRQRGINFNADILERILEGLPTEKSIPVKTLRHYDGQSQDRSIRKQQKNWRLVGDMVWGEGLEEIDPGDFFWSVISIEDGKPPHLLWDVIVRETSPDLHSEIYEEFSSQLVGSMATWEPGEGAASRLAKLLQLDFVSKRPASRRQVVEARIRKPHILQELVKSGLTLTSEAQSNLIGVLSGLAESLRFLLNEAGWICRAELSHKEVWHEFKGVPIGFVDGGVANLEVLGAAPVGIRVGSYVVLPGTEGDEREHFDFQVQLVDELFSYDSSPQGVFDDFYQDLAKLRDAARITCEVAGLARMIERHPMPKVALLHGPLVNPVSPYALEGFPSFSDKAVELLLPGSSSREHRARNFVLVYKEQLERLQDLNVNVVGVVERASSSALVLLTLLSRLLEEDFIDVSAYGEFREKIVGYRLADSLVLECVLDEGEYIAPMAIDKQAPHSKIPTAWPEIYEYPQPMVTFAKATANALPFRIEFFPGGDFSPAQVLRLLIHMARLLPKYSFPVGLDIVDKHAKVPAWMSRQVSRSMAADAMRRAMEEGDRRVVGAMRRLLSSDTRDWLFRPDAWRK